MVARSHSDLPALDAIHAEKRRHLPIVVHRLAAGVFQLSQADLAITRRLRDALGLIDIRLLDHFMVGDSEVVSVAERGLV